MSDGKVEYEVRADTSNLESDLKKAESLVKSSAANAEKNADKIGESAEKSNKKVSDSTKKAAEETEKYRKETDESSKTQEEHSKKTDENTESQRKYKKEVEELTEKNKSHSKELSEINSLLEKNSKSTQLLAQKKEVLKSAVTDTAKKLSVLENAQKEVEQAFRKGEIPEEEYREFQKEIIATRNELEEYGKQLSSVGGITEDVGAKTENASGKFSSVAAGVAGTFAAIGAAALTVGTAAVSGADSLDKATNQLTASLGLASDEAERYEDTIKSIYANNYGEGFEDIANNIALVKQQMSDISDEELQKAVESGYLLNDVYGIDFQESLRGANAMVNQFGISATEAYNLMAQGAEKGLNQNGDLADQLAEYATYYNNLGFSAEQAFNMMAAGAENGVYQIDKINDAVKEFSIRAIDGSDSTKEGFEALGLDAETLAQTFAEGGEQSATAFQMIIEKLAEMDDKVAQDAAGVALFGTQWEDVGAEAILALGSVNDSIDVTRDKLGEMAEVKYTSLSDMFEAIKRSVELLLIPLGEQLIPVTDKVLEAFAPMAEEVILQLTESVLPLIECILGLIDPLMLLVSDILPPAIELIQPIISALIQLAEQVFPILSEVIGVLIPPLTTIIESLLPPLLSVITSLLPVIDTVLTILTPILALVVSLLEPITALLNSGVVPLINVLVDLINLALIPLMPLIEQICNLLTVSLSASIGLVTDKFDTFTKFISNQAKNLKEIFGGITEFVSGVFEGNWEKAWNGVRQIFDGIWHTISATAEFAVNGLIDLLNGFIEGINALFGWMGANVEKISHVDWTADDAEEQAKEVINDVNNGNSDTPKPSGKTTADYYEAQGKAKLAEQQAKEAEEKAAETAPVISGNTVNGMDYSYIPQIASDTTNKTTAVSTAPKTTTNSDASSQKGNVISITSYIPTIWDDEEETNEKLKKSLGAELVGNSSTGKLVSGIENAATPDTSTLSSETGTAETTTLSDVINAIKSLEKSDENRKISLTVDLHARELSIGTAAIEDINDITRMNGKSPLIK